MRVTLTELVDVVSKAGTPKATKVAQIKARQGEYSPQTDFYKMLRDRIVSTHKSDGEKSLLDGVMANVTSEPRLKAYPPMILAYKKWWGRRDLEWFAPPTAIYARNGVSVSINPELGLLINGVPHVVKLYFKADQLKKTGVDLVTALMQHSLAGSVDPGTHFAVLDIRHGKFHVCSDAGSPAVLAMVNGELAYIAELWTSMAKAA